MVMKNLLLVSILIIFVGCTVVVIDSTYREHEKMSIGASTSSYNTNEGNSSSE